MPKLWTGEANQAMPETKIRDKAQTNQSRRNKKNDTTKMRRAKGIEPGNGIDVSSVLC
jgi:hypothetical protein